MSQGSVKHLRVNLDQASLLRRVTNRIRRSVKLEEILGATVAEVRSFLRTDRVKVYKFNLDGSGQVIAESIHENCLPSLLGLNFPGDDIPAEARELFVQAQVRSIVNVESGQIGLSPRRDLESGEIFFENIRYRSLDPCHAEYLTAMGVKSSVVVPILHEDNLWGLLVSHHCQPRAMSEQELQGVQLVVDYLSVAIAQSILLTQARAKAEWEATVHRIATILHSLPTIELQPALEATVAAFGGSGGRLCIRADTLNLHSSLAECLEAGSEHVLVYTGGKQPQIPAPVKYSLMEQYSVWQERYKSGEYDVWAISDIYQTPQLRNLQIAFRPTSIRSLLMIPLYYRQQLLGYLTIFRDAIDIETLWAGKFDQDGRQLYPQLSFDVWCQTLSAQAREWTKPEIQLAEALSQQFATAIYQYELYQHVQTLNTKLENQVLERTIKLQQVTEQQQLLFEVVAKIRSSLDLDTIFNITTKELRRVINADRVAVYRFDPNSAFNEGEFITEDVLEGLPSTLAIKVCDHCFGENYANKYSQGRVHVVPDIDNAGLADCHVAVLAQFQIKAQIVMPLMKGNQLWGLLCIHQCYQPRAWETSEIQFAIQIANQLGVALEQADLLAQTKKQAFDLKQAGEQQRVLFEVVAKMRKSLDLDTIFSTMSREVRRALNADRVGVYRFDPDSEYNDGEFVAEDVLPSFPSALAAKIHDHCFGELYASKYSRGRVHAVADFQNSGFDPCYLEIMERFEVKANMIAPVIKGNQLWGLLCIHQCASPREWQLGEIQFATQIAAQLSVALEQADLLTQTREQAEQLAQALQELQQTQTQLIQTEKMSSLGQLVAGVAHEINNPVNFIYGNIAHAREYTDDLIGLVELYQRHCSNPHPEICAQSEAIDLEFLLEDLPKMLSSMKIGADRIRQLVLSLRNFSRLDEAEMKPVNIHEGIDSTLLILQHRLKPKSDSVGIQLIKEYGDLPLVECYAGQLNQVFMNVIGNAIDALEQEVNQETTQTPKIWIQTSVVGANVAIRIADNGEGMPESVIGRIFDPFYTTKPVGKGTGLGLSITYQIVVEKHGGILECTSQPGKGTQFYIQIPILQPNLA